MVLLVLFAFIGGIVTILSPCILPVLPIILSSSLAGGRKRPLGVVTGFVLSFTFFTLFLTSIVKWLGIPADALRQVSILVIFVFGWSLLIPLFQTWIEKLFGRLTQLAPKQQSNSGFGGGVLIGASIGLLWTPCVGPILASVISLALTGSVSGSAALITFAYALGTALPMLAIVWGGNNLLAKRPWLVANTRKIQQVFGLIMILTAIGIYFNIDRKFQSFVLGQFPSYGVGLTKFEDNSLVKQELEKLNPQPGEQQQKVGKPMFDLLSDYGQAPELIPGGEWFNLPEGKTKLTLGSLHGQVVLVDFWTYTCINCIRTLPYLKSWDEKYRADGLVIIGVHTPEFEFEKIPANVKKAIADYGLKYPVMQDNDYSTWSAYRNHYWPAKYLIDRDGKIRYTHFGEGNYDETEEAIQSLLEEAGKQVAQTVDNPEYQVYGRTPETYLGYGRMMFFDQLNKMTKDEPATYELDRTPGLNHFGFTGQWQVDEERAMPFANATLVLSFEAKEVFLVMRPKGEQPGTVKVYLDNQLVSSDAAGEDVSQGTVMVDTDRLYKLIKLPQPGRHVLKLEFVDDNLELYAFTFG